MEATTTTHRRRRRRWWSGCWWPLCWAPRAPGPQAACIAVASSPPAPLPQSRTTAQEMPIRGDGGGRSRRPHEGEGVCNAAGGLCKMEQGRVGHKPPHHL
ncbi:hypothetical protein PAHAL_3G123300 [Panicum hallii]|uniref:Uncharacterized protein n=1 Tax=Panicum hallii TaxID=206008 RepID=A0A2T8KI19_9POAL|nr:hypothetical protein PAHAL_3G123300 [Panicum hallii]